MEVHPKLSDEIGIYECRQDVRIKLRIMTRNVKTTSRISTSTLATKPLIHGNEMAVLLALLRILRPEVLEPVKPGLSRGDDIDIAIVVHIANSHLKPRSSRSCPKVFQSVSFLGV